MRLGPNKLTISKLDNIELREITGITRSNLNSMNQT
jgi:DNA-binding Xre family transcriptional regulator